MKKFGFVISALLSLVVINTLYSYSYAHTFYKNQDSVFFTFVRQFEIENNLASDTLQSNKSISLEHSENAANLLKHIASIKNNMTDNANFVKAYNKIFDGLNLTTKALVAANLADEALKEYGLSQGLNVSRASSLLNMTMNTGTTMKMEDNITMPSGSPNQALNLANKHLISRANFGTSTMIAKSLKILFLKSLKNATLDKPSGLMQIPIVMRKDSVKNLEHGI